MKKSHLASVSTLVFILILLQLDLSVGQLNANDILENKYVQQRMQQGLQDVLDRQQQGRGWIQSAQKMIAGPTGQMLVHFAKEMISRSAGNSQVLSLNLTNLLILVLLKALIFAAGLIGAGHWGQYGRGRSIDGDAPLFEPSETPLLIGFLAAEGSGQDGCLQRAACHAPETASEYLKAARAILKGSEIFDDQVQFNPRYNHLIQQLEHATMEGMQGAPCETIYGCMLN